VRALGLGFGLRVSGWEQNRRQKVFSRGTLRLCGGLDILKLTKTQLIIQQCFIFQFGMAWSFVWGGGWAQQSYPVEMGLV